MSNYTRSPRSLLPAFALVALSSVITPDIAPASTPPSGSDPVLSSDGRIVAFASTDISQVPGLVTTCAASCSLVMVQDRDTGVVTLVSKSTAGVAANDEASSPAVSATGRYVAFVSAATNLDLTDVNDLSDVFLHDRVTGTTVRVSVGPQGESANEASSAPAVSADGRYVSFISKASNLVASDVNGVADVFVRDMVEQRTFRLAAPDDWPHPPLSAVSQDISGDGRWVVAGFAARPYDTPPADAVLFDRVSGSATSLVSASRDQFVSIDVAISSNGRWVTVTTMDVKTLESCLVHDRESGRQRVILAPLSYWRRALFCGRPSDDGRIVPVLYRYLINTSGSLLEPATGVRADVRDNDLASQTVEAIAVSADARYAAVAAWDGANPTRRVHVIPLDMDGDGLPSFWESAFGLDPSSGTGPNGGTGDPDADGRSNVDELSAGTHPRGFFKRHFAEGAVSPFFQSRLAVLNPGTDAAHMLFGFSKPDGSGVGHPTTVGGPARATLDVRNVPGMTTAEFSTTIESDVDVVVDRTMTWGVNAYGSTAETSIAAPSRTWYLAEGATHSGFDLFCLIQNATDVAANVHIKYLLPTRGPIEKDYRVGANARFTIWVDADDERLANTDVSAVITSDVPVIVERAMYLSTTGHVFEAGHDSAGVTSAATEWFLAEGATGPYFDEFILLANPGDQDAHVEATYLLPDGSSVVKAYVVLRDARYTVWVDAQDERLADTAVSAVIRSVNGVPIVAERSMWWPGPTAATWAEAHNAAGLTVTGSAWAMAEGEVGGPGGAETYILIANRGGVETARVTLYYEDGLSESREFVLLAGSRTNVAVGTEFSLASGRRFGAVVEALDPDAQLVVERAMYSNAGNMMWAAGTSAVATRLR